MSRKTKRNPRGEYWIDDGGSATFADGDVGDMNHASMVIDNLAREMLDHIGIDVAEPGTLDQHEDEIRREIHDSTDFATEEDAVAFDEAWDNDPADALYNWMKAAEIDKKYYPAEGQFDQAFFHAYNGGGRGDPRDYALTYWGWVRVQGKEVQVHKLDRDSLKTIARGLADILDQEGEHENEEEQVFNREIGEYEIIQKEQSFNIEVVSTKKYYTEVPLSVIEEGDPAALRVY